MRNWVHIDRLFVRMPISPRGRLVVTVLGHLYRLQRQVALAEMLSRLGMEPAHGRYAPAEARGTPMSVM